MTHWYLYLLLRRIVGHALGQSAAEYAVLLGLIVLVTVTGATLLGQSTDTLFQSLPVLVKGATEVSRNWFD